MAIAVDRVRQTALNGPCGFPARSPDQNLSENLARGCAQGLNCRYSSRSRRGATQQLDAVNDDLGKLSRLSTATGTIGALEEAATAIDDLTRMDARARDHSAAGQDLMASDLFFTDGLELARNAARHVDSARSMEWVARDRATIAHRKSQGVALATAMGTGVLVALLLLPVWFPVGFLLVAVSPV